MPAPPIPLRLGPLTTCRRLASEFDLVVTTYQTLGADFQKAGGGVGRAEEGCRVCGSFAQVGGDGRNGGTDMIARSPPLQPWVCMYLSSEPAPRAGKHH